MMMDYRMYQKYTSEMFHGKRVKTLREMRNGFMTIPAGTVCRIYRKTGLSFEIESDPCEKCGCRVNMTKVRPMDLELLDPMKEE